MALYRAPRVFEQVFNLENFIDVSVLQSFIGFAQLSASNVFQRVTTFASDVIIATRLTVTDLNVLNTFLGYDTNIFSGIKAPLQAQIDSVIAGGIIQSTVSVADTKTLDAGSAASVKNIGTSISANLEFSIPRGPIGPTGDVGGTGSIGPTGCTGAIGPIGIQGYQGLTGPIGPTGPTGQIGPIGIQGYQGLTGPVGPTGDRGLIGPMGATGVPGSSTNTGSTGNTGPTGCTGPMGLPGTAVGTGATGATGCTGAQGDQGIQGPQGNPGPQGNKGSTGPSGKDGKNGSDGSSFDGGAFLASSALAFVISGIVGTAIIAFMGASTLADSVSKLGYATIIWVDSKVQFFTAYGIPYEGSQKCAASLTLQYPAGNAVILSNFPDTNSYFGNTVDFNQDISVKGKIVNTDSNSSLDIKSTSADLNLSSTSASVNIFGATEIALNAPSILAGGYLLCNDISGIAVHDTLNLWHDNVNCNKTFKVSTISEQYDANGLPLNLTLTHPKVVVNNKMHLNELRPVNAGDTLDISHNIVSVLGSLQTDTINSTHQLLLNTPTTLTIGHDNVKVPVRLQCDRIGTSSTIPVTIPPTESTLTIQHDNVVFNHALKVNSINSIGTSDTIKIIGKTIVIGDPSGSSDVLIYGNVSFIERQNAAAFWNEVNGYFQQNDI